MNNSKVQIVFYSSRLGIFIIVFIALAPGFVGVFTAINLVLKLICSIYSIIILYWLLFYYLKKITVKRGQIIFEYPLRITNRIKELGLNEIIKVVKGPEKGDFRGGLALKIYTKGKIYYLEKNDIALIDGAIELFYS